MTALKTKKLEEYIANLDNVTLVRLCNDIYQYRYVTGVIEANSAFGNIMVISNCTDAWILEEITLNVADKRFSNVVRLLLSTNPRGYIK